MRIRGAKAIKVAPDRPGCRSAARRRLSVIASLFDALPLPAFGLAGDGRVVGWTAAAGMFGWSAADVLGRRAPFASGPVLELLQGIAAGSLAAGHLLELAFVA